MVSYASLAELGSVAKHDSEVTKVPTTVASLNEDESSSCPSETWRFEEDAYTVGLRALLERNKSVRRTLPHLLFSLLAPALQVFIACEVYAYLTTTPKELTAAWLSAQIMCSVLCLLQLSDETVEGVHKLTFSLRWLLGFYQGVGCSLAGLGGALLAVVQTCTGLADCLLCIQVIFTAGSTLDAFFNYVALAFIADVDNLLMRSRLVRNFVEVDAEVTVWWASADKLRNSKPYWGKMMALALNLALLVTVPASVFANTRRNWAEEHPVHFDWAMLVPRALALAFLLNFLLWWGSRRYKLCVVAGCLTAAIIVARALIFLFREVYLRDKRHGCLVWSPLDSTVLEVFSLMMMPTAWATDPRSLESFRTVPLQVHMVTVNWLMWVYELSQHACA